MTRKYTVMSTKKTVVFVLKRNDFKSMMTIFKNELDDFVKDAKRKQEY